MGWTVSDDSFTDTTPLGDKTFVNVIAVHDPSVSRRLTLACHYDSKLFTDDEFIAATDSAVPCALMVDVARALNASLSKVTRFCLYSFNFLSLRMPTLESVDLYLKFLVLFFCLSILMTVIICIMQSCYVAARKLGYRKGDRAMCPIDECPENFWVSLTMPMATFPEICNGLFFDLCYEHARKI